MIRSKLVLAAHLLTILAAILALAGSALAVGPKEKILYSFRDRPDGALPEAGLIFDVAGSLYGTTDRGGTGSNDGCSGCGAIFKLEPNSDGTWTESVLYSFGGNDGLYPDYGLIFDTAGNLYSTTQVAGCCGEAFELKHTLAGWQFDVIHAFQGHGGSQPRASLVLDKKGNLYGTAVAGGGTGMGAVFKLSPQSGGTWSDTLLYGFKYRNDGAAPQAPVTFDESGNLYGTTTYGGNNACPAGCGTVFKLTPTGHRQWKETLIHQFSGTDGASPFAGLVADRQGNFYGSAGQGGSPGCFAGCGTIFRLHPVSGGKWKLTVLHIFKEPEGGSPAGVMVFDGAGNLYGTTVIGGNLNACPVQHGCGVVFKLAPGTHGKWKYTVLHKFNNSPDGALPNGIVMDNAGNLYGTTIGGGTFGVGTVFEVTP